MADRDYTIVAPDGRELTITGPDNASPEQLRAAAEKAFSASKPASMADKVKQQAGNLVAGAVRGAGSIGATLLAPVDVASDLIDGKGLTLDSNRKRRAAMDSALGELGADTNSLAYKGGKLAGEIAGTAGAGGLIARGTAGALPTLAAASPRLATALEVNGLAGTRLAGAAPNVLRAIETAGMAGGSMPVRMAGGAITGAASAGLVNPEDAAGGAMIGGAMPAVIKGAGMLGRAVGFAGKGAGANPQVVQAARDAQAAGYVIPPSDIQPQGMVMEALGGLSGKIKTAQVASAKNQEVTDALARKALGLPADAQLNRNVLASVRQQAGQAYDAVAQTGTITPSASYDNALDAIVAPFKKAAAGFPNSKPNPVIAEIESLRSPQFDAASAVEKVKELRNLADSAYASGDKISGKALKSASKAIEDAIDSHLQALGQPASDMLNAFRDARKLIAKTYSVESALNGQTGQVSANALASALKRGKPLSGELEQIARASEAFPKATQALKEAPKAISPLDYATALIAGTGSGNPAALALIGARPAVRSVLLSAPVQRYAAAPPSNALAAVANAYPEWLYRSAPVALSGR